MYLQKYFHNTISNEHCDDQKKFLQFCPEKVLKFTYFTDIADSHGVPRLCQYFSKFNPAIILSDELEKFQMKDTPTETKTLNWQMEYMYAYITDIEFMNAPKNIKYDFIVYAIFAYIFLNWSPSDVHTFRQTYKNMFHFCEQLLLTNSDHNIVLVRGLPFTGATYRIVVKHLEFDYDHMEITTMKDAFSIKKFITKKQMNHFQDVFNKLCSENWEFGDQEKLHQFENTGLFHPILERMQRFYPPLELRPKYITGMACCGKTTFLRMLSEYGWLFRSRGDIGTFGGKSKIPAQVAALHGTMDFVLRKFSQSVIGDRGPIDNPLWNIIMPLCAPKHKNSILQELLLFFESMMNEGTIGYHGEFNAIVFLDMYPSRNRQRMIKRSTGGDAHRGRLPMYAIVQFMAYYLFASFFGLTIFTVPYTSDGSFDLVQASNISYRIRDIFGKPTPLSVKDYDILQLSHVSKHVSDLMIDMKYSEIACILK